MSREFRMPSLGSDMEGGKLVEWRVQPGTEVHRGDVVALVETEKGVIEVEAYVEGRVEKLLVSPGERSPVGAVLALLSGDAPGAAPEAPQRQRVSPAARARAASLGVALEGLKGSGPGGAVTLQDVEAATATLAAAAATPATPATAAAGMRHAIALAMSRAKREIPHYYLQLAMDLEPARAWLEAYNKPLAVPDRLLMTVLQIKAVARAARQRPGFSGYFQHEAFVPGPSVNVGVAIALRGGGLVAPAIADADGKSLAVLMRELQELVARVRGGHLRSTELSSATITVTSLGEEGVDAIWPVINPPQVAIVAFGSLMPRPWVIDGQVLARPVMTVSLAADHRVSDGRQGAQFLAAVRDQLARPSEL
jgi:pyruvate dehydrogenase E2 component (dihydrolipoamide acetyltransferase)